MPTFAEVQIDGVLLEEIDADISALTIDLQNTVTATALASLLRGLAAFYKVGVRLDGPGYDPFVTFKSASPGGLSAESSDELLIANLIIGTPNKVRVVGRSRWLRDLRALIGALAFLLPPGPGPSHDFSNTASATSSASVATSNVNVLTGAAPTQVNAAELAEAIYKNVEVQQELDAQLQDGKISLTEYIELRNSLEKARGDLAVAMSIARTRINH